MADVACAVENMMLAANELVGRKETEVARRIKGGMKRRETDPASNH